MTTDMVTRAEKAESAARRVAESLAGLSQSRRLKLHDRPTERTPWNRVDVVEVDDAVRRDIVLECRQFEFGNQSPHGPSDRGDNDRLYDGAEFS